MPSKFSHSVYLIKLLSGCNYAFVIAILLVCEKEVTYGVKFCLTGRLLLIFLSLISLSAISFFLSPLYSLADKTYLIFLNCWILNYMKIESSLNKIEKMQHSFLQFKVIWVNSRITTYFIPFMTFIWYRPACLAWFFFGWYFHGFKRPMQKSLFCFLVTFWCQKKNKIFIYDTSL